MDMSMVTNLASGVDITMFSIIFMRSSSAVGVHNSPMYLILFLLTLRQVRLDSFFLGRKLHWKLPYVASFYLLCVDVKNIYSVYFFYSSVAAIT